MNTSITKSNDFTSPEVLAAREQVMDQQITPLLEQIKDLCLANNIAWISLFNWGNHPEGQADTCSSAIFPQNEDGTPILEAAENLSGYMFLRRGLAHLIGQ